MLPPCLRASTKRPRDVNQPAKMIVDILTGEVADEELKLERKKNPAAVALGKLGTSKGGKPRVLKLSTIRRREIAKASRRGALEEVIIFLAILPPFDTRRLNLKKRG